MKHTQKISSVIVIAGLIGFSVSGTAAQDLTNTPVDYGSDGDLIVRIVDDIRIVELQDNVQITQGELAISGDQAIIEFTVDTNELIRATVHGTPVQYQQSQENSDEVVTGSSNTIILYKDEISTNTLVEMIGDATIRTADSVTSCVELIYDTALNIIPSSTGPCAGSFSSPPN